MLLRVDRVESDKESTLGKLFVDGRFECWTLEDEYRAGPKVYGETRIPAGRYRISLRREGGFHANYLARYGDDWHQGMLHILDVPGFEYILIHVGNSHDDTMGCLLVGVGKSVVKGHHYVTGSRTAYEALYPKIRDALLSGDGVEIEYRDLDSLSKPGAAAKSGKSGGNAGAVAGATAAAGAGVATVGGVMVAGQEGVVEGSETGAGGSETTSEPVAANPSLSPAPDPVATDTPPSDAAATPEAAVDGAVDAPPEGLPETTTPVDAPSVSPPPPESTPILETPPAAPPIDSSELDFEKLVDMATAPENRLEVILIALGVLIVIFAMYLLVRRWGEVSGD